MTIALFSDIHANLPALEACLADMESRRPDQIFCLGDLVGYNIWPNEVIREIRRRGIPTIAGNYDYGIGRKSDDCGHTHKPCPRILHTGMEEAPHYRHTVNIGSVGKPKDGDPRGCFALITLDEQSSAIEKTV